MFYRWILFSGKYLISGTLLRIGGYSNKVTALTEDGSEWEAWGANLGDFMHRNGFISFIIFLKLSVFWTREKLHDNSNRRNDFLVRWLLWFGSRIYAQNLEIPPRNAFLDDRRQHARQSHELCLHFRNLFKISTNLALPILKLTILNKNSKWKGFFCWWILRAHPRIVRFRDWPINRARYDAELEAFRRACPIFLFRLLIKIIAYQVLEAKIL